MFLQISQFTTAEEGPHVVKSIITLQTSSSLWLERDDQETVWEGAGVMEEEELTQDKGNKSSLYKQKEDKKQKEQSTA